MRANPPAYPGKPVPSGPEPRVGSDGLSIVAKCWATQCCVHRSPIPRRRNKSVQSTGAETQTGINGASILPTLLGKKQKEPADLYWEQLTPDKLTKAIRMGKWKAYQATKTANIELYDLTKEPAESTYIAAHHPNLIHQIQQILAKSHTKATTPPTDPRIWENYREDTKRLDALLSS